MKLEDIKALVQGKTRALIVGHDYPDPDCLASAWGMKRLFADRFGLESDITFGGFLGRAGNRAMVKLLRIEHVPLHMIHLEHYDFVLMVDTQPGTGNNSYDGDLTVDLVIDHHPTKRKINARSLHISPDCGSTTSVVADLLFSSGMEIDPHLATALFLGIRTDTLGFGRDFCSHDWESYLKLFPMIDQGLLSRIERPDLAPEYFRILSQALGKTCIYGKHAISHLGPVQFPEAIAEYSDMILQLSGINWVLCSGEFRSELFFSLRMRDTQGDAGELARTIANGLGSAGGHEQMAGGKILFTDDGSDGICDTLTDRFLADLGVDPGSGKKLC